MDRSPCVSAAKTLPAIRTAQSRRACPNGRARTLSCRRTEISRLVEARRFSKITMAFERIIPKPRSAISDITDIVSTRSWRELERDAHKSPHDPREPHCTRDMALENRARPFCTPFHFARDHDEPGPGRSELVPCDRFLRAETKQGPDQQAREGRRSQLLPGSRRIRPSWATEATSRLSRA
jgi:hypothetical protein